MTKSKSLIFELKQAIQGGKDLNCKKGVKTDIKENNQANSFMDLASRMILRFGGPMKSNTSSFSVKSQNVALHFAI